MTERPTISERVHCFGAGEALMGIVTLPAAPMLETSARRPFVLLLNAGLVHRVGPFGMGVALARGLAGRGFRVLRFDQSGLGDSPPHPGRAPIEEQVVADGRAAMDSLAARYGASVFAVGGSCSGALNAHRLCLADRRVVGAWLLDGYAYPTRRYHRQLFLRRVRNAAATVLSSRRIRARAELLLAAWRAPPAPLDRAVEPDDDQRAIFYQDWPAVAEARADIESMLHRGVRLLFVYTGGWSNFVDPRQFDEMFPRLRRRGQIEVTYYARADHSYLALADRAAMVREVGDFLGTLPPSLPPSA